MNNYALMENFLNEIKRKMATEQGTFDFSSIHQSLISYNIPHEEQREFPQENNIIFFDHFSRSMADGKISLFPILGGNFLCFKHGEINENAVKLYLPFDKNHIVDAAKEIFGFMISKGMVHNSKIASNYRNDDFVIRVNTLEEAEEIIDFINSKPELAGNLLNVNPFTPSKNGVGITLDYSQSFNEVLCKLIYELCEKLNAENRINDLNVETLHAFIKEKIKVLENDKNAENYEALMTIYSILDKTTSKDFKFEDFYALAQEKLGVVNGVKNNPDSKRVVLNPASADDFEMPDFNTIFKHASDLAHAPKGAPAPEPKEAPTAGPSDDFEMPDLNTIFRYASNPAHAPKGAQAPEPKEAPAAGPSDDFEMPDLNTIFNYARNSAPAPKGAPAAEPKQTPAAEPKPEPAKESGASEEERLSDEQVYIELMNVINSKIRELNDINIRLYPFTDQVNLTENFIKSNIQLEKLAKNLDFDILSLKTELSTKRAEYNKKYNKLLLSNQAIKNMKFEKVKFPANYQLFVEKQDRLIIEAEMKISELSERQKSSAKDEGLSAQIAMLLEFIDCQNSIVERFIVNECETADLDIVEMLAKRREFQNNLREQLQKSKTQKPSVEVKDSEKKDVETPKPEQPSEAKDPEQKEVEVPKPEQPSASKDADEIKIEAPNPAEGIVITNKQLNFNPRKVSKLERKHGEILKDVDTLTISVIKNGIKIKYSQDLAKKLQEVKARIALVNKKNYRVRTPAQFSVPGEGEFVESELAFKTKDEIDPNDYKMEIRNEDGVLYEYDLANLPDSGMGRSR